MMPSAESPAPRRSGRSSSATTRFARACSVDRKTRAAICSATKARNPQASAVIPVARVNSTTEGAAACGAEKVGQPHEGQAPEGGEAHERDADAEGRDRDAEALGDDRGGEREEGDVVDLEEAHRRQRPRTAHSRLLKSTRDLIPASASTSPASATTRPGLRAADADDRPPARVADSRGRLVLQHRRA